jgi:hypothetical protein
MLDRGIYPRLKNCKIAAIFTADAAEYSCVMAVDGTCTTEVTR